MQPTAQEKFDSLVEIIKEVKPGLAEAIITPQDSVVENLGLDSLDILQLSRKIRTKMRATFDLDAWSESAAEHKSSVQSILDNIEASAAAA